jgi:hypothetical protein
MAFAGSASFSHDAGEVESRQGALLAGLLIAGALIAMAASSYVGTLKFSPSTLNVSATQVHSSPVSLAQSKSGAASSSSAAATISSGTLGTPDFEGAISPQAAASAFDKVGR